MAQQHLNVGTTSNDGTGDTLRASQIKVEANFDELYARPDFTDAPSNGNTYGRKDGAWEEVTGGSGTTPTLQAVTTEGNETTDEIKAFMLSVGQGTGTTRLIADETGVLVSYDNLLIRASDYETSGNDTQVIAVSTGNNVQSLQDTSGTIALTSDIPTTATEVDALKRDGSNANADVDIATAGYSFITKTIKIGYPALQMEVKSDNLLYNHTAQWQNQEYTGIEDISNKGVANGYAPLNSSSQVPSANLPAYVDDIIEGYLLAGVFYEEVTHTTVITGEVGKIYIDLTIGQSSKQYRWSGSVYNQITNGFIASTADVPDSTDKRYQTDAQQAYNDATSSIQTQIDSKQNALSYTPFKYVQTSQTLHTGTTSETIVATETISGGVFNANDSMKALFKCTKVVSTSTVTMRLRINTSNTLSGATLIGTLTLGTANTYGKMNRTFDLNGGTLYGYNFASSLATDNTAVNTAGGSASYNTANTLYFFWTVQLGTSSDSVTPNLANLTN